MNCEIKVKRSEKKTNAQKCKEYRERKKLDNVRAQKKSAQQELKKPKTDGERSKLYRERQKIKKLNELEQNNTKKKPKLTRAEYMKEYRRKAKLKNVIIKLNGLPPKDHSDVKKKKTVDVQQRNQNKRKCKKPDSQSECPESKQNQKRRAKTKLIDPPRTTDDSQTSEGSLLVPIQEEVKKDLPETYLQVTIKVEVSESEDVSLRSSGALCEGAGPQRVLIKKEANEVFSEINVEVTIKEELPDSEDVS